MKDKVSIGIIFVLVVILFLVFAHSVTSTGDSTNRTNITLEQDYQMSLPELVSEIKNDSNYDGYDNDTVAWMESLGYKEVFITNDSFVIMNSFEAQKIPTVYVCDAYVYHFISCDVLENHSLGNVKDPKDVVLVQHIDYQGEDIVGNGLA